MLDGVSGFNNLTLNGPGVGGDFDGDGKTDLVYASSDSNALIAISYINGDFKLNGFTGLGSTALDLAAVDVNGDGKPDIVTAAGPTAIVALNNTPFAPRVSGALNAASFAGKALASGSLASAFGLGFATGTTIASKIPLPMSLADVTMTVGGVAAPLLFVSPTQMNFQVPWMLSPGPANLQVTVGMTQLTAVSVTIGAVNPGIFTLASGSGQAIAVNQDGSLVAPAGSVPGIATHPAKPGDMITIYATGLGAVSPSIEAGAVAGTTLRNTVVQPTILIGGVSQKPAFSGLAPQFVGVNQINVAVPQLSAGIVPLQIQAGGVTTSDQVTIAVGN